MTPAKRYNIAIDDDGNSVVTIVHDGETVTITDEHSHYEEIVASLISGEDPAPFLTVAAALAQVEDKNFEYDETTGLQYKGQPVPETVADAIIRYAREGRDTSPLGRFMQLLEKNPDENSREQLWNWLKNQGLTLDTEGYIVGYKAVESDMQSRGQGHAFVDGKEYNGRIPNHIGAVVTMPRSEVVNDPGASCSIGLHVGTHRYASTFIGGTAPLLEVRVDPADVVSVPRDSNGEKMRCCKYEVLAIHDRRKGNNLKHHEPEATRPSGSLEDAMRNKVPDRFFVRLLNRIRGGDDA